MLGNLLNFSDPSKNSYYFSFIIIMIIIILLIHLIKEYLGKKAQDLDIQMDKELSNNDDDNPMLISHKKSLKSRYLLAYIITRCTMWAEVPYLYYLLMTVHKFSFAEIGFLFLIYTIGALFFGTIIHKLAYKSGRKLFCHIYNFITIIKLLLLIQGVRILAYIAIIIASGFSPRFIKSIFESWLITESERMFQNLQREKERFIKRSLIESHLFDGVFGIMICVVCAFIYEKFGITYPFWISIILSLLSSLVIKILWDENILLRSDEEEGYNRLYGALKELKKLDILCIGLIEGLVIACINIYFFSWTPILKQSTNGEMNVGFIFTIMLLAKMTGFEFYHMLIINLRFDYYTCIIVFLLLQGLVLFLIYYINTFLSRIIFLSLFNGLFEFYFSLNSKIKSDILVEQYKAIIKILFTIPTNIYIIIIFLHLSFMNCFTLYLISSIISLIAFVIGICLVIYIRISKRNEENNEHEGYNHLMQHDN